MARRRDFRPIAQFARGEFVRAFAIVQVFKEGYGEKPDRIEVDLWSLGSDKREFFLNMPPTNAEAARVGWDFRTVEDIVHEGGRKYGGRLVRVLGIVAAKSVAELSEQDARRKFRRGHKRAPRDFWTVKATRTKRRVKWEGAGGTRDVARATAGRVRKSRDQAQKTPGGRSK